MNMLLVSQAIFELRQKFLESPAEIAAEIVDEILKLEEELKTPPAAGKE